jgi:hypothetical protein
VAAGRGAPEPYRRDASRAVARGAPRHGSRCGEEETTGGLPCLSIVRKATAGTRVEVPASQKT